MRRRRNDPGSPTPGNGVSAGGTLLGIGPRADRDDEVTQPNGRFQYQKWLAETEKLDRRFRVLVGVLIGCLVVAAIGLMFWGGL